MISMYHGHNMIRICVQVGSGEYREEKRRRSIYRTYRRTESESTHYYIMTEYGCRIANETSFLITQQMRQETGKQIDSLQAALNCSRVRRNDLFCRHNVFTFDLSGRREGSSATEQESPRKRGREGVGTSGEQ